MACSGCALVGFADDSDLRRHQRFCAQLDLHPKLCELAQSLSEATQTPLPHARLVVMMHYVPQEGDEENSARLFNDLLCGIHVPSYLAKTPPQELHPPETPEPEFECPICLDTFAVSHMFTLDCPESHRYCFECIRAHAEGHSAEIRCPGGTCSHSLSQLEVDQLFGTASAKSSAFSSAQTAQLLSRHDGFVKCPGVDCDEWIELPEKEGAEHERWECACPSCGTVFCNICRGAYHYRTSCQVAADAAEEYKQWLRTGRDDFQQQLQEHSEYEESKRRLDEENRLTLERHREFQQTEEWKAQHCRMCPTCGRVVEKIKGCNLMKCGQDYHGGNKQPGCGAHFYWTSAPVYAQEAAGPKLKQNERPPPPAPSTVDHSPYRCDHCQEPIIGLRFSCIHCRACDYCQRCEWKAAHERMHVFLIFNAPPEAT
eukprot:TRINITY_DN10233_c0_g1_i1.p1 TRINITY_DN10233_c0_g1~~TRINITY_DN10233_c0_g1_i1.p1  ORF type:complete len:428 (-),score=117.98 TRINITY_DN10233_c0_g1_i1:75-1358(-)